MAKLALIPIEDHLIIEKSEKEIKTKSGIILPEKEDEPTQGKVVAIGDWRMLDNWNRVAMDVKVGDIVYFTKFSPHEIDVEEDGVKKAYYVLRYDSILAVARLNNAG